LDPFFSEMSFLRLQNRTCYAFLFFLITHIVHNDKAEHKKALLQLKRKCDCTIKVLK